MDGLVVVGLVCVAVMVVVGLVFVPPTVWMAAAALWTVILLTVVLGAIYLVFYGVEWVCVYVVRSAVGGVVSLFYTPSRLSRDRIETALKAVSAVSAIGFIVTLFSSHPEYAVAPETPFAEAWWSFFSAVVGHFTRLQWEQLFFGVFAWTARLDWFK